MGANGRPLDVGLHDLEKPGAAKTNGGMFEKGLVKALESDHHSSRIPEVKVVGNGHCHGRPFHTDGSQETEFYLRSVTENCKRIHNVWMCFGGGRFVSCIVTRCLC